MWVVEENNELSLTMSEPHDIPGLKIDVTEANAGKNKSAAAAVRVKAVERSQVLLRPVNVEELIEEAHPARAIWAVTDQLQLESFYAPIEAVAGVAGRAPWDPRLLISLWVYAYSRGISSAREITRRCGFDPGFQWLCGAEVINYHTLSDFRVRHEAALKELFVQLLGVLSAEGLVSLERVMHDGTKIQACVSRKSFRREETLRAHLAVARQQVEDLSKEQPEEPGRQLAAQKRAAQQRQQRVENALKELEQIRLPKRGQEEKQNARASTSDPQARIMKQADGGFAPSYNVQISTEASHKIVVGVAVSQCGNDYAQLEGAIAQVEQNLGSKPQQVIVDGGFTSRDNIVRMAEQGIDFFGAFGDQEAKGARTVERHGSAAEFAKSKFAYDPVLNVYRCPAGQELKWDRRYEKVGLTEHLYRATADICQVCQFKSQCCPDSSNRSITRMEDAPAVEAFRQKMETSPAQAIYKQRSPVAEFPNAWLKDKLGLRRFRLRGLTKVVCEALWAGLTYNIQQWIRLCWRAKLTVKPA
jgi:transposase